MGNNFLANIKAVDGIYHLVRSFGDEDVVHVEESVDPIRDVEIIHEELRLKDAEYLTKLLASKSTKKFNTGDKSKVDELEYLKVKTIQQIYSLIVFIKRK